MAGGTTFTGGWHVVNAPAFYEEAATGYASVIATATATIIGAIQSITIETDKGTQEFRMVGSEDIQTQIGGEHDIRARISYNPVDLSTTFINYAIKANANASSDISRSIHIVWSERIWQSGSTFVTTYFALRGCKPTNIRQSGRTGQTWITDVEVVAHSLTFTSVATAFLATGGFPSNTASAPWNFDSGGLNPFTLYGRVNDITEFDWIVDRNVRQIFVLGSSTVAFVASGERSVSGNFTAVWLSQSTYEEDFLTQTSGTLSCVERSGAGTFTATGVVLLSRSLPVEGGGEVYERYAWRGKTPSTF